MSSAHAPAAARTAAADYCPHCDETTALTETGRCPWCSTRLTHRPINGYQPAPVDRPVRPVPPAPKPQPEKVPVPPERSLAQRMDALNRANDVRTRRAQLKRDMKAGRTHISDVLADPPDWLDTAKIFDLLLAVPKYGRVKVNKILVQSRISPSKTIGGLSERQRTELIVRTGQRPARTSRRAAGGAS